VLAKSILLRTLMVCFTVWLIATEIMVFDQLKFDAKQDVDVGLELVEEGVDEADEDQRRAAKDDDRP
jgi:hypothetical protein